MKPSVTPSLRCHAEGHDADRLEPTARFLLAAGHLTLHERTTGVQPVFLQCPAHAGVGRTWRVGSSEI